MENLSSELELSYDKTGGDKSSDVNKQSLSDLERYQKSFAKFEELYNLIGFHNKSGKDLVKVLSKLNNLRPQLALEKERELQSILKRFKSFMHQNIRYNIKIQKSHLMDYDLNFIFHFPLSKASSVATCLPLED